MDPKILQVLGHRVPLEGEQSAIMLDIVGVINDKASHVILPDDVAIKSGADFDIDTEYMLTYNLEKFEDGIRTVPYYDKLTAENEDYLYRKYLNARISDIVKLNLITLKTDARSRTQAKIHDSRNLTDQEFDTKLKELFEFKDNNSAFYKLPRKIRAEFKSLEYAIRKSGKQGFDKFKIYASVVDLLWNTLGISQSKGNVDASILESMLSDKNVKKVIDRSIHSDV